MKFYLTGGALRDTLLKLPVRDKDYIIVDADKQKLKGLGFTPVGIGYEVFLHPKTHDEYSLALNNNLYEELKRRDLTINSMAFDEDPAEYYDPFNGQEDIANKLIRHTSEQFAEDPIRILRLARFKAQLEGFEVHSSTKELCLTMAKNKSLFSQIPGERFLLEFEKALGLKKP